MKKIYVNPLGISFLLIIASFIFTRCKDSTPEKIQTDKTNDIKKDSLAFGDINWVSNGLMGKVYLLAENTNALPDFDTMKPVNTLYTTTLNVPTRNWESGFPGLVNRFEWFAIEYKGNFKVKNTGHYTFRLVSDDGSKLFIDKKLVIDNDGGHPTTSRTGEIDLDNSLHSITVQYFQGPRYEIALQLFAGFNKEEEIFPGKYIELSTPGHNPHTMWLIFVLIIVLLLIIYIYSKKKKEDKAY